MAVRPNTAPAHPSVSLSVTIATIAIVLILIGGFVWHAFGSHAGGAPNRPLTANETWFQQKTKETGGDYSKLTRDDKRRLYAIDGPQGPFLLQQAANDLKHGK